MHVYEAIYWSMSNTPGAKTLKNGFPSYNSLQMLKAPKIHKSIIVLSLVSYVSSAMNPKHILIFFSFW